MKRILAIILSALMLLALAGCGSSKSASPNSAGTDSMASPSEQSYFAADDSGYWNSSSNYDAQESELANIPHDTKMVYRADIDLESTDYGTSVNAIRALVQSCGGYFENKSISQLSSGYRYGVFTVRVPAAQFEQFCTQVGELCHMTHQSSSADNITETYYDTDSRLKTAQIKLERLQELLKKADAMEDIITIENAISEVEYQVENLSGTLRHYDALVDYSTVCLTLSETYKLSGNEGAPLTFGTRLARAFTSGLRSTLAFCEDLVIGIVNNLVLLLVLAAAVVVLVRAARKRKLFCRRKNQLPASEESKNE